MKPNQLWLDFSQKNTLRVWVDAQLQLAQARGPSQQRLGFFREIPLYHLNPESAKNLGWTSFSWDSLEGKFHLEKDFWIALEASRLSILEERPEKYSAPLSYEFPLASDVLFYGGSFEPWHQGHEACVRLAPNDMTLIVCPDRNPHKPLKTDIDILKHYYAIKKALSSMGRPFHIHPGFLLRAEANPTVGWILRLKHHRPDLRIHLLMGYDSFRSLSKWTRAEDLMKLVSGLQVVSREENDEEHNKDSSFPLQANPNITIRFLGHHAFESISGTELRKKQNTDEGV